MKNKTSLIMTGEYRKRFRPAASRAAIHKGIKKALEKGSYDLLPSVINIKKTGKYYLLEVPAS